MGSCSNFYIQRTLIVCLFHSFSYVVLRTNFYGYQNHSGQVDVNGSTKVVLVHEELCITRQECSFQISDTAPNIIIIK